MQIPKIAVGAGLVLSKDWCGTSVTPEFRASMASLQALERSNATLLDARYVNGTAGTAAAVPAPITIPVYMTGVVNTTNPKQMLDETTMQAQFDVLVDRFAPYNIKFSLKKTTRVVSDDYARGMDYYDFMGFKGRNRQGDYGALNLYYVSNMDDELWGSGSCTLPADKGMTPDQPLFGLDGCTLQAYTVPGGVDKGKTYKGEISVHEVGHWLGLLHTFDGEDCDGPGDGIDDTPAESVWELNVCPKGRDSCPGKPGLDPISNFMDYSGEGCWTEFTKGQNIRMHNVYNKSRKTK